MTAIIAPADFRDAQNFRARGAVGQFVDDAEAWLARRPEPLAWPMAAIGVVGGWYIDEVMRWLVQGRCFGNGVDRWRGTDDNFALAAAGGLGFFVLGHALARMVKEGKGVRMAALVGTLFGGFVIGSVGLFLGGELPSFELGLALGVFAAPWAVAVGVLGAHAWRARPDTLAHRLFRRMMWLAVAGQTAAMVLNHANEQLARALATEVQLRLPELDLDHIPTSELSFGALVAAVLVAGFIALRCARDAQRLRRLHRRLEAGGAPGEEQLDLGLGDEVKQWHDPARNPYRDREQLRAEVRGDYRRVQRALAFAVFAALALLGLAVGGVLMPRDLYGLCS